eukprot:s1168_g2.t1
MELSNLGVCQIPERAKLYTGQRFDGYEGVSCMIHSEGNKAGSMRWSISLGEGLDSELLRRVFEAAKEQLCGKLRLWTGFDTSETSEALGEAREELSRSPTSDLPCGSGCCRQEPGSSAEKTRLLLAYFRWLHVQFSHPFKTDKQDCLLNKSPKKNRDICWGAKAPKRSVSLGEGVDCAKLLRQVDAADEYWERWET